MQMYVVKCYKYFYSVFLLYTYTAKETLCDPTFSQQFLSFTFKTTSANGNCSFGLGNVGTYNSTFMEEDIAYQAFNNPAGQYNYTQLLNQAEMQTYIITELFNDPDISPSMFNIFLPNEAIPTTDFLSAPAPDGPITTGINPINIQSTTYCITTHSQLKYKMFKYRLSVTSCDHDTTHSCSKTTIILVAVN